MLNRQLAFDTAVTAIYDNEGVRTLRTRIEDGSLYLERITL